MKHAHTRDVPSSEHISIHYCVSAAGHTIPSSIILKFFPGGNYTKDGPDGCLYGKQESGLMDCDLFFTWFQQLFLSHACPTAEQPVMLLSDGHISPVLRWLLN